MKQNFIKLSTTSMITAMIIGCGGGGGTTPSGETQGVDTPNTPNPVATVSNSSLCGGVQTDFALSKEVNGDLNIVKENTEDCYKIHLSSNNGAQKYAFFMTMLPGTKSYGKTEVTLIDENNQETPLTTQTLDLYKEDNHIRKTFDVTKDGTYFIKIKRETNEAKYAFSLHPSVENGLVQNKDKEINDTPSMAAPITLEDAMKDISGSLHVTRDAYNSLRNSDDTDYYSIDIEKAGKYTFFMNHLPGTESYGSTDVRFIDEAEAETPIPTETLDLYKENDNIRKEITLTVGTHKIKIYRESKKTKYAFSLYPSIANGLKQDNDREPNDTPSMAAPITMTEAENGINGSLNLTRNVLNSMHATDNIDMYRISITEAGVYTVDMSLLSGTENLRSVEAEFISDNGKETPITTSNLDLYQEGTTHSAEVTLVVGSYYLRIYRDRKVAKYSFKMTKKN